MQKFTRAITREIEVEGDRIAMTFDEKGLSFRLVGTRRQPVTVTWPDLISLSVFQGRSPPTPEDLANALASIGGGQQEAGQPDAESATPPPVEAPRPVPEAAPVESSPEPPPEPAMPDSSPM